MFIFDNSRSRELFRFQAGVPPVLVKARSRVVFRLQASALSVNFTFYRTLDPALGCWWQIDPKAEAFHSMTPYNSMFDNPILYVDPLGDAAFKVSAELVGAVVGATVGAIAGYYASGKELGGAIMGGVLGTAAGAGVGMSLGGSVTISLAFTSSTGFKLAMKTLLGRFAVNGIKAVQVKEMGKKVNTNSSGGKPTFASNKNKHRNFSQILTINATDVSGAETYASLQINVIGVDYGDGTQKINSADFFIRDITFDIEATVQLVGDNYISVRVNMSTGSVPAPPISVSAPLGQGGARIGTTIQPDDIAGEIFSFEYGFKLVESNRDYSETGPEIQLKKVVGPNNGRLYNIKRGWQSWFFSLFSSSIPNNFLMNSESQPATYIGN